MKDFAKPVQKAETMESHMSTQRTHNTTNNVSNLWSSSTFRFLSPENCEKVASKSKIAVLWNRVSSSKTRSQCALQLCVKFVSKKKNKFISLFGPWEKNFKRHLKSAFYVSKGTFWASKKIWCEKSVQNASLLIKQSNPFAQIIRRNGQTSSKKTTYWEKDFLFVINFDEK